MQPASAPPLRRFRFFVLCAIIFFAAVPLCFPQELSFDQRVACRQALGDDPRMVAECLARPLLTDRLLRNWYAGDGRFHGGLRGQIENELIRSGRAAGAMRRLTGAYSEVEWIRGGLNGGSIADGEEQRNVRRLGAAEWDRMLRQLIVALRDDTRVEAELSRGAPSGVARSVAHPEMLDAPVSLESLPLGRMSRLIERDVAQAAVR